MEDLLRVFESHMSIHGREQFLRVIRSATNDVMEFQSSLEGENLRNAAHCDPDGDYADDAEDGDDDESDSDFGGESSLGDFDSMSSESDIGDIATDNDSIAEDRVGGIRDNLLTLHDPIIHGYLHCPPFDIIDRTINGECDCYDYGMIECCKENNFSFFQHTDFDNEYLLAMSSLDEPDRLSSNLLRKRLYKQIFHETDIGILEKHERRKLPNCAVAKVRQIYPNENGKYMGFKEN